MRKGALSFAEGLRGGGCVGGEGSGGGGVSARLWGLRVMAWKRPHDGGLFLGLLGFG